MNQHTDTKCARIRAALRKLGRATTRQLACETGIAVKYVQSAVPMMAMAGHVRQVGVLRHHEVGPRGKFGYIYEISPLHPKEG